ncbi:hypothetical protein [Nocardia sp. BMG51109]|uniref:hypothetical protein n=1 Tax=Nocardia sp. BMG51109 TaxID=1056816 RepID=UPI0012EBEB40|nr:hypothetical protein [Nocardia sp. BMG51109]
MRGSRSDALGFMDEVTARYGSLDAFFAHLRADLDRTDDEPTLRLPIVTEHRSGQAAWPAVAAPGRAEMRRPDTRPSANTMITDPESTKSAGRQRKTAAAVWDRLIGRG